jgi:nucleoside-diphosphate-sugar epimerase
MTVHIIGARGRLGQAIAREYASDELCLLQRSLYESWSAPDSPSQVAHYFEKNARQGDVVFVTSGLLDPNLPNQDLFSVNYHLPKNVIDGASKVGLKVVTFGTIMETLLESKNPYIQSKAALSEYIGSVASADKPVIHMRIHTLYGIGQPSPFMFLGQMLSAIHEDQLFKMTSGRQLREYHHLQDEAAAIRQIECSTQFGVINLSHGKPQSLRHIAEGVFSALGKSELLQVGGLSEPPEENYATIMQPASQLASTAFRESLPAVIEYMQNCYARRIEMKAGCLAYDLNG